MRMQDDVEIEVAVAPAIDPLAALPAQPQPLPVGSALRNADGDGFLEREIDLGPAMRFVEREVDRRFVVLPRNRTLPPRLPCAAPEALEEIAEVEVVERERLAVPLAKMETLAPIGRRAELLPFAKAAAELVVGCALLGILQRLVRLGDLLELLLRAGLLRDVGVVLLRRLAVRLLDLVGARCPRHPEDRVVILVLHLSLQILPEPRERTRPRELLRLLVVARRRVVVEAMVRARLLVDLDLDARRLQRLLIRGDSLLGVG